MNYGQRANKTIYFSKVCLATLLPITATDSPFPSGLMAVQCTVDMLLCTFYFIFLGHKHQGDIWSGHLKFPFGHSFGMFSYKTWGLCGEYPKSQGQTMVRFSRK